MNQIFLQAIGFVGAAIFILSYLIRYNRALFLFQLLGCLVFCVQFILMGAYSGAMSLLVNVTRNLLLLRADRWPWVKSRRTLAAVLLLLAVTTALTWSGWQSLLPAAAVAITSVGYWTRNARKIRVSQLFGTPLSLLYDVLIRSWGGVLIESLVILSILVSILRFGWKNLGEMN